MHDRSFSSGRGAPPPHLPRARRPFAIALFTALSALASACAPSIGGAVRAYEHGRYPEALEELLTSEQDAAGWRGATAARYALYRGLSHLALGDLRATHFWFGRVDRALASDPQILSPDETVRLASARAHLPR